MNQKHRHSPDLPPHIESNEKPRKEMEKEWQFLHELYDQTQKQTDIEKRKRVIRELSSKYGFVDKKTAQDALWEIFIVELCSKAPDLQKPLEQIAYFSLKAEEKRKNIREIMAKRLIITEDQQTNSTWEELHDILDKHSSNKDDEKKTK